MLITTSRPELDSAWARNLPISRLPLAALDERDGSKLFDQHSAPQAAISEAWRANRIRQADGIPGCLIEAAREPGEAVPAGLRDYFAAQLDLLGDASDVARVAAIPTSVDLESLAGVLDIGSAELAASLDRLRAAGILESDAGAAELRFRRELLRRYAWDSLLPEDQERLLPSFGNE